MEITYGLRKMVEEGYKFNYNFDFSSVDIKNIHFLIGHSLQANKKESEIIVNVMARLVYGDQNIELVTNSVRAAFYVAPYDEIVGETTDEGIQIKSNPLLIDTFINVSIGALRGMLIKNLKGSPLEGKVLPLIPMDMIRKNATKRKKQA